MSTDITTYEAPLPERMQYAKALSASGLIPQAFKGQPANVLVAIEYGHALGIAPIVALSEINVIQGTPSLSASLMAALALSLLLAAPTETGLTVAAEPAPLHGTLLAPEGQARAAVYRIGKHL